jgi:hypothetical protein
MHSISTILEELKERKEFLEKSLKEVNKSMTGLPEGKLRTVRQRNLFRYYEVTDPKDRVGKYIHVANIGKAKKLAHKDYYEKLKKQLSAELDQIEKMLQSYSKGALANKGLPYTAENVYANLSEARKILVSPFIVNDEEYAKIWENMSYNGNTFREEEKIYGTKKEEMVRSKSEVLLADMFYDLGIPYRYECELNLKNGKRIFPDFTLLKKSTREEIYHEHLGMLDEEDYLNHNLMKIETYRRNGIFVGKNLILTFESASCPMNIGEIRKSMKEIFCP